MNTKPLTPTNTTPEQYVAEYFNPNGPIEYLRDFVHGIKEAIDPQWFVVEYARKEAQTDNVFFRAWFTTDYIRLMEYVNELLNDD